MLHLQMSIATAAAVQSEVDCRSVREVTCAGIFNRCEPMQLSGWECRHAAKQRPPGRRRARTRSWGPGGAAAASAAGWWRPAGTRCRVPLTSPVDQTKQLSSPHQEPCHQSGCAAKPHLEQELNTLAD